MTTEELREKIARKLHEVDPIGGHSPDWKRLSRTDREWYMHKAAALLPIVEAEVSKAKAEALRKIAPHLNDIGDVAFLMHAADQIEKEPTR